MSVRRHKVFTKGCFIWHHTLMWSNTFIWPMLGYEGACFCLRALWSRSHAVRAGQCMCCLLTPVVQLVGQLIFRWQRHLGLPSYQKVNHFSRTPNTSFGAACSQLETLTTSRWAHACTNNQIWRICEGWSSQTYIACYWYSFWVWGQTGVEKRKKGHLDNKQTHL